MELLKEIQIKVTTRGIRPEECEDRIIFMSMFNDIDWSKGRENFNVCFANSLQVGDNAKRFQKGHWSFLDPGDEGNMVWNARLQT